MAQVIHLVGESGRRCEFPSKAETGFEPEQLTGWRKELLEALELRQPLKVDAIIERVTRSYADPKLGDAELDQLLKEVQGYVSDLVERRYSPFAFVGEMALKMEARGLRV